ncbi:MAG: aminotransferase class III-fold pyridoxal phosphate-dependent enzyme [Candidatus Kapabacteria bacterium]|nr:aminotransferase class III-fold pyridoxal phosphate-dependent enzyme [Candidatus Kapabacteria bacterium]
MSNFSYPNITASRELAERASGLIPAYTQTLAKGPTQHVQGVAPIYAQSGKGAHLIDVDGNRYLDYTMAIGPLILGYGHDVVDAAIERQLRDGITFSLMHPLEVEVAELVRSVVPNVESVRYSKTGCDVTTAAVRLARAFTGRDTVLCCGYHGWHDWYIGTTDRDAGILSSCKDQTYTFNYNDVESVLEAIDDNIAAIILEPMVFDEPRNGFLNELRSICDERGIVLIFDEMWTGFRIALGGAQERYGVRADLACFSKAVANGMPLSILAGRSDIMKLCEHDVFFFTTFGGEALSLAAAKATIQFLRDNDVPQRIEALGDQLRDGLNARLSDLGVSYVTCKGLGTRTIVSFDGSVANPLLMKSYVQQELIARGILWGGFHNMSDAHTIEDVQYTLGAYNEVLYLLDAAVRWSQSFAARGTSIRNLVACGLPYDFRTDEPRWARSRGNGRCRPAWTEAL